MSKLTGAGIYSSSHLKDYKSNDPDSLFKDISRQFDHCYSFSGISLMPDCFERESLAKIVPKPKYQIEKVNKFIRIIQSNKDIIAFFLFLSNDWKCFLSKDLYLISLSQDVISEWNNSHGNSKCNYDAISRKSLTKESRHHMNAQFDIYKNILKSILLQTDIETLYHSSVLERLNPRYPHLDLLFAILNSYLLYHLNLWTKKHTFKNKHGKSIKCVFLSATHLFHLQASPQSLFCPKELKRGGEVTHRTPDAIAVYISFIKSLVN